MLFDYQWKVDHITGKICVSVINTFAGIGTEIFLVDIIIFPACVPRIDTEKLRQFTG